MASGTASIATIVPQSDSGDWIDSTPQSGAGEWVDTTPGNKQSVDIPDPGTFKPAQPKSFSNYLQEYWDKINPVTAARGVGNAVVHPLDTANAYIQQQRQILQNAESAYKEGNYSEAARHAMNWFLNGIPGVGAALDEAGNKMASGDIGG